MLDMRLFNGEKDSPEEEQAQKKPSTFGQIFDNIGAWGSAAYANTRDIGLSEDIRDLYERLYNGDYANEEEYNRLAAEFQQKQNERRQYKQDYENNMKVLKQNDSYLKDFTEIGGTVQGIGTQLKDTATGAGIGAVTMGAMGAGAGGIGALPAAVVGAAKGATWGNRIGAFRQAYQDAKVNAIDAWERVLQEGGTAEQAEQAYSDALVANLPTEALDVIGNLYFGSKILGNAVSSNMAQKLSKSALGKTAEKVSRFDLPAVVGTNVAKKFGSTAGKIAGGVTASTLEGIGEAVQEPWQDYETERAIDIQRRIYDPENKLGKDVRDHSVFGDGGLLDYYTTPEGRETAWKSFKMGAAFGGIGSALSASQFTELGTAHQDSIDAGRQLASEFSEGGEFFGTDKNYDNVRKMMGNIYGLTEDERDSLSKEDVYRMYVDYWTNKYTSGGLFSSGNRQEVNAVMQADLVNALTGQETNRVDQLNDYSRRYVDKYSLNPDNSIFNDIKQQQEEMMNQEERVQEAVEQSEQNNGEDVVMTGKFKEGNYSPETSEEAKERNGGTLGSNETNQSVKKSEWYDLPDKFGKQWVWADDGMDSDDNRTYRNTETGRLANVERVKVGKKGKYNRYTYRVKDITNGRNDPNTIGVGGYKGVGDKNHNNEFTNVKQVEKYLNLPRANKQDTAFMEDSQHGNEQAGIKQTLPQEDGVIASKDIQTDAEGNQVYNGRIIQSKDAVNVHSMDDLDNYFREHGDLMSTDLYAEVARGMMRFGIGDNNKTSIVLDLANDKSGALGSKTTWMENPNDPNSAIAKAVIRLYAGADLVTAAHEIAHLGWINLSDQDKNTFARWAIDTEEEFVARVLGFKYDENFSAYLLEALTNQGEGGSIGSQALWQKIKEQGATKQTIDILNKHANDQNLADAIDERFAWEFSNWFAQGYVKGEQPHNVIERILQKACQSMGDALNLLYDTDRYLNDKNYRLGASGRDVADIFNRISATRKDRSGMAMPRQQEEPVSLRTEMRQPIQEAPYNLGQGFDEAEYSGLYEQPNQDLTSFYGEREAQTSPWWKGVQQGGYNGMRGNLGTINGTPTATPITEEEDPEPKKKRSKEHKEWEKRQKEKQEAKEKEIKDAKENVKTKLDAAKDLYNKKASVEDLTKAVDELYNAAMSARNLSTDKEFTDLIKNAFNKAAQFGRKINELEKRGQQTTRPISNVGSYYPVQGETFAQHQERIKREREEQERIQQEQEAERQRQEAEAEAERKRQEEEMNRIRAEQERQNKEKVDKLKKDIKTNIDKANKSLNAKKSKLSLEDVNKLITNAEDLLNNYKNIDPAYYDEKTAGEFEKAIEALKKKLEEKKENEQKAGKEQLSQVVKTGFTSALNTIKAQTMNGATLDQMNQNYNKNQKMLKEQEVITQAIDNIEKAINQHVNARDIANQIAAVEWEIQNYTNRKYEQSDFVKKSYNRLLELQKKLVTEKERQEEEEKKRKEQEKTQNILNKVKNVDELKGLSDEAKIVYYETKEILDKKGSSEVKPLAHENAVLFARICERIAQMYKQAKVDYAKDGSPVTAKTIADNITLKPDSLKTRVRGSYGVETDMTNHSDVEKVTYLTNRIIETTRLASPSTFLHETTHMYAFEMQYLSQIAPNSQAAKDYKALMKWAGFTDINQERNQAKQLSGEKNVEPYLDNVEFSTGHAKDVGTLWYKHEKIAIAFEEYLRTGKVPSPKLKGVFARLKQWILNFFNDLKTLSIKPTDEIQSIFDRMILTDEELKEINSGQEQQNKETPSSKTETQNQNNKNSKMDELLAKLDKKYKKISITGIRKIYPFNKKEKEDIQFWIGEIREALVNGKDLSQFDKRIRQHAVDNAGLPWGDARDVEKYVNNYLNDAKKIRQEIDKISSATTINQSDTKMQESSKEEIARNRKPTVWSISATGGKTAIRRSKYGVGKDVSGQIYFHKDYAEDVIPLKDLKKARDIAHREGFTEDKYNCMMYDTHTKVIRFDEAPDFDTHREPITGKWLRVYPDGRTEASKGGANQEKQIWHHKWLWVKEDYKGFDVQASRDWSEKWLEANKGQGRPSGKKSEWDKKLRDIGLGKYIEDTKMQEGSTGFVKQESGNPRSSQNQIPAVMTHVEWKKGTVNADIGGGKYDTATNYMKEQGVDSSVFDPYNRTPEHNLERFNAIQEAINKHGGVDTVTVANVLNVIPDEWNMLNVIHQAAEAVKQDGVAYFLMYEKEKDGIIREVKGRGVQRNEKTEIYKPRIEQFFDDVKVVTKKKETIQNGKKKTSTCKLIEARKPKFMPDNRAFWTMDANSNDTSAKNIKQLDLSKKNAEHTALQVASKNAQNQTRLNAKSEQVLEKLFRRLVRDKKITDANWNKGNIDRLKKYTNIGDKGIVPRHMKLNPNDKRTMDAEYLDAVQKVNDYLHQKYPYLKNIYRGVDGHWRFEFSDKDAKLVDGLDKKEKVTTLGKVLKHDNLYKFYPKLKNLHVSIVSNETMSRIMGEDPNSEYDGAYDPTSKYIYLNKDSFKDEDMRKVLLHEVQHAIQDIEGLANGDTALNEENYDASAGEREANQTEDRANMSDEELQNNPRRINPKEKTVLSDVRAITDTKMQEKSTPLERTKALQELANRINNNMVELNVASYDDPKAREFMDNELRTYGWTFDEIELLHNRIRYARDTINKMREKYPLLNDWESKAVDTDDKDFIKTVRKVQQVIQKTVPVDNPFISNGDYTLNTDFGTMCMKKEAMDAAVQIIIDMGLGQNLGSSQMELIKDILIKYKMITPCDMCFVEAKRARVLSDANKSAYDWKSVLIAAKIYTEDKDGNMKFLPLGTDRSKGSDNELTEEQIERLQKMADKSKKNGQPYKEAFEKWIPEDRKRHKDSSDNDLDTGTTADKMAKIAKLILEDHSLAGELNPLDLVSTRGIDKLFLGYGGHTGIVPTFSGMYGSATSKPIQSFRMFDPRAWIYISEEYGDNKIKKNLGIKGRVGSKEWLKNAREGIIDKDRITESIYDFGGMRLQSFSDYNPILFFDYCQFIADCEGRYLPMHTYTKVPYLVELFNQTRMMMNMSFIPEVVVDLKHDELDENGKLKHAGLKYNPETGEFDLYAWHKDSFPIELGYEYRKKYDYAGTIAVGISDAHIRKMMADPEIDMIIPYHKSGMPLNVQIKTGLVYAKSYEYAQTIGIDDEAKKKFAKEHYSNYEKKMQGTPDQIKRFLNTVGERMAKVDLNYSRLLFKEGDPHKAAQKYLDLCKKYGCTPVFEEFAYKNGDKEACIANQGYYKMLEDFRGYDTKGNAILQKPVQLKFPEGFEKVLEKSISDRTKMKEHMNKMLKNEDFLKDLKKALEPQRIDGEIRTQMMKGLRSALGQNNVITLAKKEFFDELEKYYQSGLTEEEAKAKVEVFRQMNGTVYGFAHNNKIYLNENVFNAGTPAHEFTHVWARVAQNMNEKLWNEGVRILKEERPDLWHEVETSSLYGNIADNDNAIASEVLARLVAQENVDFIKQQLEPSKTMGRGKGLVARIKIWCMQMFDSVRSIFDNIDDKPLTFDEFVKMPLKALWDTETNTEFRSKTREVIDSYSTPISKEQTSSDVYTNKSDTKMQEKSASRPLNQQRAITILDGKYQDGKTINFTDKILDHEKKGETRTTKTLTRNEDLGITNDKQNVVGVIRLGDPRPLQKYDKNGNETQDYINSMIKGTDYDIDDNNLDKDGKPKYFYPITVVKDYRKNPKKITKHVSQAYKEYDDTKMQAQSTPKTYPDQNKDVYSVTFTKSAQRVGENQKKMAFYRKNDSYWRENKNKDGSITFTRKLPFKHHQRTLVYDDINGLTVGKKKKTKFREYYEAFKDQIIKWWFNDKHFLYKAAKNAGAINSYMRMMVMKDQGAVASAAIEDGIVKHNSKKGERTKSLNSIIEAVGEANQTDFLNYCEAFRIIDLYKRGIRQKMDLDLAYKEIEKVKKGKNAKLFEQQRKYFVEYNHELLWVLVDGGFITEEQYNDFVAADPNFVPLSKNMEELEDYVGGIGVSKKMINAEHPIHKIGTSMREVKNPFLEMQRRTVEYYVKASRNKAGRIFVNDIAEAIALGANGNAVAVNQGMLRKLKSRDQNGNPISMDGKQNIFYVWNEGEKEYYQVADREIYEALRSFDSEQMGALKKIVDQTLGRASRLVRNTATMTPDFGLRNLCRDNVEAFISSEHGFLPFIDAFWGMYQMANDTQWFREYQKMNGEPFNTLNRDGEDVATVEHDIKDNIKIWKTYFPLIKKDYREFIDKDRSVGARAKSLLLLGTDVIGLHSLYKTNKKLNDYLEVGTRIGEYRNARMGYRGLYGRLFEGKGNKIFTTDRDLVHATNDELFAAYKSKDITLNFGQHGTIGKELNRIIPFFNASLQGIYKIGNTIDNMVHGNDNRIREELLFKFILMGAMGMAAALAGQGDDDYEEAPEYEHDSFWILPNGIRIPKDQLFGRLVGGTVEKATRQYLKDGDIKKKELVMDVLGNFAIDKCIPALIDLGMGTVGNYDSFRKKSVTPEYMADKLGYLQKDLSTSKAAVDISEIMHKAFYRTFGIDVGAKKIDFVISKTLSNLGKYATNLYELTGDNERMTRGAEAEDKGGFAEWSKELPYPLNTMVGTFATNRNSFQSISDFYERYRELKTLSSDESIMTKNEKRAWTAYKEAYKKDKQFRDALKAIKQDKSLTGAQKRQKADKIFKQQIQMSRKLKDWEKKHGLI